MEQQQLEVTSPDQVDNSDNKSNSSKISESKFLILYYPIGKNKHIFFRSECLFMFTDFRWLLPLKYQILIHIEWMLFLTNNEDLPNDNWVFYWFFTLIMY